jgi:hypothetical protein
MLGLTEEFLKLCLLLNAENFQWLSVVQAGEITEQCPSKSS